MKEEEEKTYTNDDLWDKQIIMKKKIKRIIKDIKNAKTQKQVITNYDKYCKIICDYKEEFSVNVLTYSEEDSFEEKLKLQDSVLELLREIRKNIRKAIKKNKVIISSTKSKIIENLYKDVYFVFGKDIYEKLTTLNYCRKISCDADHTHSNADKHETNVLKYCINNGYTELKRDGRDWLILKENGNKIQLDYKHIRDAISDKKTLIPNKFVSSKNSSWKKPTKKFLIEIAKKKNLSTNGLTNEVLKNLINKYGGNNGETILLEPKDRKFPKGKYIIHQIRGSHDHPDIVLLNVNDNYISILPIECKSGKGGIMWNDNVPYSDYYFYLFTDSVSGKTLIFPGGHETVMPKSVKILYQIFYRPLINKLRCNKSMSNLPGNDQFWDIYPRFNYQNSKPYNFAKVDEKTKEIWKDEWCRRYKLFIEFTPYISTDIDISTLNEKQLKEVSTIWGDMINDKESEKEKALLKKENTEKDKRIAEQDNLIAYLKKENAENAEKDDIIAELKKQLLAQKNTELNEMTKQFSKLSH